MKTLAERGAAMQSRNGSAAAGGTVMYARGAAWVSLPGTFGETEYWEERGGRSILAHTDLDFIFAAELLILGGSRTLPEPGDTFTTAAGEVFEALPIQGKKCYRTAGRGQDGRELQIRVHGKRIKASE